MPASFGVHGPGDSTIASGCVRHDVLDRDLIVAMDGHLAPSSPRKWKRLKVKLS